MTEHRHRRAPSGIALHRTRSLHPDDVTTLRNIPITSVARTLVDLAAVFDDHALERAVHEAEVLRLLDVPALSAAIDRAKGRRGVGRLRRILGEPSPGVTRSDLEERFLELCRHSELPLPLLNAAVHTDHGRFEVDALWPVQRVIVELDGAGAHLTRRAFENDRRRDAALVAEGYLVVRLTWRRLRSEPRAVTAQLRRILSARRVAPAPTPLA